MNMPNTSTRRRLPYLLPLIALAALAGCAAQGLPVDQDPRLAIVPIPADKWMPNESIRLWVTAVLGAMALGALIQAFIDWKRTGKPGMICLMLGAAITSLIEPFEDFFCAVWYPRGDFIAFEFFGRPMPVWTILLYVVAYGTLGIAFYKRFLRGVTRKELWVMAAVAALSDMALEIPLVNLPGTYFYYGNEPLMLFNFPVWMSLLSAFSFLVSPGLAALMTPHLSGWRWLLIPLMMPLATLALGYSPALTLPAFIAINHDYPWVVTQLLGLATCSLCLLAIWGLSQFMCTDSRYDLFRRRVPAQR